MRPTAPDTTLRDFGDGLILRRAALEDTDAVSAFNADVLRHQDAAEPDARMGAWARDLMQGRHPGVGPADFLVVEDTRRRAIVSSLCLISHTWSYGGIELAVGQPELVGTDPAYRGRGLVRALFDVIHEWSAARRHQVQAIDGIPWFYRQFGYEMALAIRGGQICEVTRSAMLRHVGSEPLRVRPAAERDLAFIAAVYDNARQRYFMTCVRDDAAWRYEFCGRSANSFYRTELRVLETPDAQPVGFLGHARQLWGGTLGVVFCELAPGVSWDDATPGILRYLLATGAACATAATAERFAAIGLTLGTEHPIYAALAEHAPRIDPPYAWYLRVPDVPGFIRHVAPVLEARLARSPLAGHSGELLIGFYRNGLRLVFAGGRLRAATSWQQSPQLLGVERGQPTTAPRAAALFPDLTFLQLLFGHRGLDELEHAFADCVVRTDAARTLLRTLFPKQPSHACAVF